MNSKENLVDAYEAIASESDCDLFYCGNCAETIWILDNYCWNCGKKIRWEKTYGQSRTAERLT